MVNQPPEYETIYEEIIQTLTKNEAYMTQESVRMTLARNEAYMTLSPSAGGILPSEADHNENAEYKLLEHCYLHTRMDHTTV